MILFAMHGGPVPREIEHYVMTGWFFLAKSYGMKPTPAIISDTRVQKVMCLYGWFN